MKKPLVSICITTYNHAGYIGACLDSILAQKVNFNYEICLGEDESSDGTRGICEKYARNFPDKIKLFLRSRKDVIYINNSPTGRYNYIETLKSCKGKYIAICDGDDYWIDDHKLMKQINFMQENTDFSLTFTGVINRYELYNKEVENQLTTNQTEFDTSDLLESFFIRASSILFLNVIKDFPKWFYFAYGADQLLMLMVSLNGKVKYLNEPMITYRIHSGGITRTFAKKNKVLEFTSFSEGLRQFNLLSNSSYTKQVNKRISKEKRTMQMLTSNFLLVRLFHAGIYIVKYSKKEIAELKGVLSGAIKGL